MNVLDENVPDTERDLLTSWRVRVRHIGRDVSRPGVQDDAIIPFLLTLTRPTLFTRDRGFFNRTLCHASYGIVVLNVEELEIAHFVRRLLRHPSFNTEAKRMGKVALVGHSAIRYWQLRAADEQLVGWAH